MKTKLILTASHIYVRHQIIIADHKLNEIIIATPDPLRLIQAPSGFVVNRVLDRDQNYYIPLPAGWKLRMRVNVAILAGQTITVLTQRKDF